MYGVRGSLSDLLIFKINNNNEYKNNNQYHLCLKYFSILFQWIGQHNFKQKLYREVIFLNPF
jgi:hypothetical protein